MKWVRCIKKEGYQLSEGKLYKVIDFHGSVSVNGYGTFDSGLIVKINDNYDNDSYFVMKNQFEDVSLEVERDKKLNKLLEYDR
jgi:hypothetical protein